MHPQTVVSRHRRSAVTSVMAANRLKRDPNVRLSVRRESSLRREPVILQQTQQQQVQAFLFVPRVSDGRAHGGGCEGVGRSAPGARR